jgi:MarR family protease production transcriptional regulator HPr
MEADLNKCAKSVGLTIMELNFLWTIHYEEEPTVNRIAQLTLLDSSTATQVLSRLKRKKLISVYKKKEDQRFSYIKLTNLGDEKRKLSATYSDYTLLEFIISEMQNPNERKKIDTTLDYLRIINQHFHGDEYIKWVYSLPEKMKKDFKDRF